MVQGRRPTKEQDSLAIQRIEGLKKILNCRTDAELANFLEVAPPQVSRWRAGEMPKYFGKLIDFITQKNE